MARKTKKFGMYHKAGASNRAASKRNFSRSMNVKVKVSRGHSIGDNAIYHAIACVSGMKAKFMGKGAHCSSLRGGNTPSKAAANALEELSQAVKRHGR